MRYDKGYFRGKRAIFSVTVGAPTSVLNPNSRGGDIAAFLYPIQYSLYYMGFSVLPAFLAPGMPGRGYSSGDTEQIKSQLERYKSAWEARLENLHSEEAIPFPGWDNWNEKGEAACSTIGSTMYKLFGDTVIPA